MFLLLSTALNPCIHTAEGKPGDTLKQSWKCGFPNHPTQHNLRCIRCRGLVATGMQMHIPNPVTSEPHAVTHDMVCLQICSPQKCRNNFVHLSQTFACAVWVWEACLDIYIYIYTYLHVGQFGQVRTHTARVQPL